MARDDLNGRQIIAGLTAMGAAGGQTSAAATGSVPRRTLGHTGESVSCIGLGGFHIGKPKLSDGEATRIIRQAVDHGLNFLDNSWDVGIPLTQPTTTCRFRVWRTIPERSRSLRIDFRPKRSAGR